MDEDSRATQPAGAGRRRRDAALLIVAVAAALAAGLPHAITALWWYPAATDDCFWYLYMTTRLLQTDGLLASPFGPAASSYSSVYFVLMALASRLTGLHPMSVFKLLGYIGCFALPTSMGVFVWIASGRRRTALLAVLMAGLWGGIAGWHWLARVGLPALAQGRSPEVMGSDFYWPRHFGEYRGVNSLLVSYLSDSPFYPREVGLCVFWIGLGFLCTRTPTRHRLGLGATLVLSSALVYPHLILPAAAALVWPVVGMRGVWRVAPGAAIRRGWLLGFAFSVVCVGLVAAGFAMHRMLIFQLTILLSEHSRQPTGTEHSLVSILGSHFFILGFSLIAIVALSLRRSSGAAGRRAAFRWHPPLPPGWVVALALFASAISAFFMWGSEWFRLVTRFYGFVVVWRALVAPLLVWAAALGAECLLDRLRSIRWRATLGVACVVVPSLSVIHWDVNSVFYLNLARQRGWQRAHGYDLYDTFSALGSKALALRPLPTRIVLHDLTAPAATYAAGSLGSLCSPGWFDLYQGAASPPDRAFEPEKREALEQAFRDGYLSGVLTHAGSALVQDRRFRVVVQEGQYAILGWAGDRSAAGPGPSAPLPITDPSR